MLSREEMSDCLARGLGQAGEHGGACAKSFHLGPGLSISPAVKGNAKKRRDETQSEEGGTGSRRKQPSKTGAEELLPASLQPCGPAGICLEENAGFPDEVDPSTEANSGDPPKRTGCPWGL